MKRTIGSIALSLILIFQLACGGGPLSRLDTVLDFAPLFFQGLVLSGAISQQHADQYKSGLVQLEKTADTTKKCLSDNVKTDVQCYSELATESRAVLSTYFPVLGSGKVSEWAALVQDIITLIVQRNTPTVGAGGPVDSAAIDKKLESKIDELERLQKSVPAVRQ